MRPAGALSTLMDARHDISPWDAAELAPAPKRERKLRLREVCDILADKGVEPIGAICDVLPELPVVFRAKTLLSLAEFVYPKLSKSENKNETTNNIRVTHIERLVIKANPVESRTVEIAADSHR